MTQEFVFAATGHRPPKLGGYGDGAFKRLVAVARARLEVDRPSRQISGMALGWDLAVAEAALELGIPVTAAVAFEGVEARWPLASQQHFRRVLAQCDEVVVVSPGGYEAKKLQARNAWMVAHCEVMLAMFDGTEGGTANCVATAKRAGIVIVNLYDRWLEACRSA